MAVPAGPALPPGLSMYSGMTPEAVLADLQRHPLFMTEIGADADDNVELQALQALAYDGTPLENAANFKEQGNDSYRARRWADARQFYDNGVALLAAEEKKRRREEASAGKLASSSSSSPSSTSSVSSSIVSGPSVGDGENNGDDKKETTPGTDEEVAAQERALLETLYANRAACHLELRNLRSCTLDCAAALRLNPRNTKALYRSARALLLLGRLEEADDACRRVVALEEEEEQLRSGKQQQEKERKEGAGGQRDGQASSQSPALRALAADIARADEAQAKKLGREKARLERAARETLVLRAAVAARGIRMRRTDRARAGAGAGAGRQQHDTMTQAPDLDGARVCLVPDAADPRSSLAVPVMLLYPLHLESDFIKAWGEDEALEQHLGYVLPLPWDRLGEYDRAAKVECFVETAGTGGPSGGGGGLVRVGKKVPLLKLLSGGRVEIVDDLVKIFVLPRGAKAEAWAKDFKAKRAAERGG